jgi:hypothetical protein
MAAPSPWTSLLGLPIAVAGELIRTWSSGVIVKNNELAMTGPYAMVRNPLYSGSFLMGLGVAVMSGSRLLILLFAILFPIVYNGLVRKEEKYLLARYGDAFRKYCARVPRFFPDLGTLSPSPCVYDVDRMLKKHREWRAWVGLFAAVAYLVIAYKFWGPDSLLGLLFGGGSDAVVTPG